MNFLLENDIHPSAVIGADVIMGSGNKVGPNVVITGRVRIGDRNWIGAGSVIGALPEILSVDHHDYENVKNLSGVILGDDLVIRENVQIHQGTLEPTVIGDRSFIMNQVYVAHDCFIDTGVILASSVLLAGHVKIGSLSNLGMGTTVHQGIEIGKLAMVGMGSVVTKNISDFVKAYGVPAYMKGINSIGLKRAGFSDEQIEELSLEYIQNSQKNQMLK